jgi:hypothetical protein
MKELVNYIPILTTIFSIYFTIDIYKHYRYRKTPYLLWWTLGVVTFGLGTMTESINVLFGWSAINLKIWYIVGALLGGYPLAQGTVYLLMKRRFANISAYIIVSLIIIASLTVVLSPISLPEDFDGQLTGTVLGWQWVRLFSPAINIYAFIFLVGGAIYSARRYYSLGQREAPFKGNIFIAIGGLLPGIGGTFTRMGVVEMLFITELLGLILIYIGYRIIRDDRRKKTKRTT